MNSSKHGRASSQLPRPYLIDYVRSTRVLHDSARTLEEALTRAKNRVSKPHNRAEMARIYFRGELVEETCYAKLNK